MFIVTQRHKDAFAKTADEGFEDQMVIHLRQRFPAECEELGEAGVRRRIRDGIKQAARYEIRAERDLTRFIRFMFGLRPDFDTSRKMRWVGPILKDTATPAGERLDRIRSEARDRGIRRGA